MILGSTVYELLSIHDWYLQEISDLCFETGQCCLVNTVLGDEQLALKSCGEITETQFSIQVKIQSLRK